MQNNPSVKKLIQGNIERCNAGKARKSCEEKEKRFYYYKNCKIRRNLKD